MFAVLDQTPTTDPLTDPTARTPSSERVRVVERGPYDLLFRADIYWVAVRAVQDAGGSADVHVEGDAVVGVAGEHQAGQAE